ncbi:hypothetical protein ACL02T_03905 [Pseudonocardia sp. RS010]|uniref:hypothetical protein n=1 Tax=Pseudonocardia sp. RS010 TaxID=3385979 RepID=UPI0039A1F97A
MSTAPGTTTARGSGPRPSGAAVGPGRGLLRITAAGLALADGMIHAAVLGEHFEKALYMGILFGFAIVFLGMLAIALVRPPWDGPGSGPGMLTWAGGLLLMAGLIAGYFVTRTIGLPGFSGGWNDVGLTTVAMEVLIAVLLLADVPGRAQRPG